jgi:TRAP-type C4-dicarboxylate transport system permease small subunit
MHFHVNRICNIMAYIAAGILFLLAGLTFCDVIGRRFLDSPVTGTIEMVELGMAIAAFFAMPHAFVTNSHVSAQFLGKFNVGKFKVFITILRGTLMVGIIGLMAYATTVKAIDLMQGSRVTIELEMPLYPFESIIAIAMWWSAVAAFFWTIRALITEPTKP